MITYIMRRLLLMIPTLLGIMALSFLIIQFAPGGPVEQIINRLQGGDSGVTSRLGGGNNDIGGGNAAASSANGGAVSTAYRGAQGLDPAFIRELEVQFGFDKPAHERFLKMIGDFARFDFGRSFFRDAKVMDLIAEKLPVSITLGLWTTLIAYLISIPLGIRKAQKEGSVFDLTTSVIIIIGYAIPGFLFAVLLIVLFAGGSFWQIFPLRGLHSAGAETMGNVEYFMDYLWHATLPISVMVIGQFATLTLLTKNSFLEEIRKQYVLTARMKGLTERAVLYRHVFRNAMLIVIAGFPAAFIHAFFTGSLLIESIFSLDGLGLLAFSATLDRDYPVVFASLYIFSLMGLVVSLLTDLTYTWIDPRIDFEARND